MAPDPGWLPAPVARRVFKRLGFCGLHKGGDGVAHALVVAELVLLRDVVEGAVCHHGVL